MKIIKFCHYCGKRYYVDKSQQQRSKFCSDTCFRKSKNTQINYKCDYCGDTFLIRKSKVDKRVRGESKYLCCSSECSKNIQKPKWEDIVSLFEHNDYTLCSYEYVNAKTKLEYICNKHKSEGIQSITYNNLKFGFGCKYCGIERTASARRLSFDEVKDIFAHNDMILLDQEYKNTQEKLKYICKNHMEIGVQYMSTVNAYRNHCPYCNIVKGEKKIVDFFMQHKIEFEPQKTYDGLIGVGGGKLSYDFYLPQYNVLIEYQGEQHEHSVDVFGGDEQFVIQQEHDNRKRVYANNNNIELFEIWYYDFKNIESILIEKFLI
jgi:hypothetical protein